MYGSLTRDLQPFDSFLPKRQSGTSTIEVRSLRGELAALRAQIQQNSSNQQPVVSGSGSKSNGPNLPSLEAIQACTNALSRESCLEVAMVGSSSLSSVRRLPARVE